MLEMTTRSRMLLKAALWWPTPRATSPTGLSQSPRVFSIPVNMALVVGSGPSPSLSESQYCFPFREGEMYEWTGRVPVVKLEGKRADSSIVSACAKSPSFEPDRLTPTKPLGSACRSTGPSTCVSDPGRVVPSAVLKLRSWPSLVATSSAWDMMLEDGAVSVPPEEHANEAAATAAANTVLRIIV